jgi:deferrochelatase/peroxidase EfeB
MKKLVPDQPVSMVRRRVLTALGAGLGGSLAARAAAAAEGQRPVSPPHVTDAPTGTERRQTAWPFYGKNQQGVTTPRPACGMVAAFSVLATTPEDLEAMFRLLTERILLLTQGGPVPQLDPKLPPPDSGILGPIIAPDNLTITVALGASLFANRPWLEPHKPRQLQRMTKFPNDALDADICHGDMLLQFCANTSDTNIHALRDILKTMPSHLVLRWKQEGTVPVVAPKPDGTMESARNFLGFRDGSANPDSTDAPLMSEVVWIEPGRDEPEWVLGGTYQAVRIIRNFVERWDRTPLREQERIIGRQKASGAPFDGRTEADIPAYAKDPDGKVTPLDAHIRLANPRTAGSQKHLMLRRPFNYSNGVTKSGQLDQGMLFISFQADLENGFIAVQRRLDGEPLEEYLKPVGGGFFFVLPGAAQPGNYLGESLIRATCQISACPT